MENQDPEPKEWEITEIDKNTFEASNCNDSQINNNNNNDDDDDDDDDDDREFSEIMYDRILLPSFSSEQEPLIVILETLRGYYYSDLQGYKSDPRLVFIYKFSPKYSFERISVSVANGTVSDLMTEIQKKIPIKLSFEGNAWIFDDARDAE